MPTMYDSVNAESLPMQVGAWYAGYVDGQWPSYRGIVARFGRSRVVSIATNVTSTADVLDVERGDARPEQAPGWVLQMRKANRRPIVYCSRSNVPNLLAAFAQEHIAVPFLWVADWTGVAHEVPGAVATQWTNGTAYDTSLVSPNFPERFQGGHVNINLDSARISALLRQAAAITAEIIAIGNQAHLPTGVRGVLAAAGGLLLSLEHFMQGSGSAPTKPA